MGIQLIGTYFYPDEVKTYGVLEGDITVQDGISVETGKRGSFLTFANEVIPETFLEFTNTIDEKYGLACMQKATEKATHICMYESEFEGGFMINENTADGEYDRRQIGAGQLRAGREYRLPLSATNVAIKAKDALSIDASGRLNKASGSADAVAIALEEVPANQGGEIFVHLNEPYIPVESGNSP